jgi:two-component system, OmpR family, sensor histidine kinase KdpD
VVFISVAAVVSALVDRLTRRGLQVARAVAEAEALARLAGGAVLSNAEPLPDIVAELRRTFVLDAVAVLAPVGNGWQPVASAGGPIPATPESASFAAELSEGTVLVLSGAMASAEDHQLLTVFVTQLRLAQEHAALEARAASATELQEANTLRTALLAAVSHDLRTPLASIKAAATSLLSDDVTFDRDEELGFAKTIDTEADRLTNLVTNLLDMSRVQTGALNVAARPVAVDDVVYRTIGMLAAGSARVIVDIDEPELKIEVDPGLFERVLANIIENALAWSPDGTVVRVEAGPAGDRVAIRVIDQGPGIPPDQREAVFQPFQRLGDARGERRDGVGLGLAVARGFMDTMGGDIEIEDTPGGGATVVCNLPRATA